MTFAEERKAAAQKRLDRLLETMHRYTPRAHALMANPHDNIGAQLRGLHELEQREFRAIEGEFEAEVREIEKRERANAHKDDTTR